jgi:hypothetical protein
MSVYFYLDFYLFTFPIPFLFNYSLFLSFFSFFHFFGGEGWGGGMKHNSFPAQAIPKFATAEEILRDVDF